MFWNNIRKIIAKGFIYNIWWQTLCTVQEFVIFSFQFPFFYKISPWKNSIILLLCKNVHLKWSHEEFSHDHWLLKFISFWRGGAKSLFQHSRLSVCLRFQVTLQSFITLLSEKHGFCAISKAKPSYVWLIYKPHFFTGTQEFMFTSKPRKYPRSGYFLIQKYFTGV